MKPKKEWVGKTLRELKLRDRYQLNIIAIRESGRTSATMDPDQVLLADAEIFAVAEHKALENILR
jgi:trk system potassium uptake protein TrkA